MTERTLYDELRAYCATDAYPFHMPGHKRRLGSMADPFSFDITEIDGFDNLHHAEGILKEAQERAAALYGAKEAFYLVNGSTAGILAGVSAVLAGNGGPGGEDPVILCARNVHKAVCHALYLNRARPIWLFPEVRGELSGKVDPEQVEKALELHPEARAVLVTSPTYDGIVSDIEALAKTAHSRGIPLIVDQAHGAHFGLHPALPQNAVRLGADIVITSLHKTLPALTQSALFLLGTDRVPAGKIRRFLAVYQTSSPSYVLMAGMDECIDMMKRDGEKIFGELLGQIRRFRERVRDLAYISLLPSDDPTRILVSAGGRLSGSAICGILREQFHIEAEMELPGYVLCLCGAGDDAAGLEKLYQALARIDSQIAEGKAEQWMTSGGWSADGRYFSEADAYGQAAGGPDPALLQRQIAEVFATEPERAATLHEAWDAACEPVPIGLCAGRVSGEFAYLYPPGVPLVIPGERIRPETAELLQAAGRSGYTVSGMEDLSGRQIRVLK